MYQILDTYLPPTMMDKEEQDARSLLQSNWQKLSEESHVAAFESFIQAHGKEYATSERSERFSAFKENRAWVHEQNLEGGKAWFGLNEFADLTFAEFKKLYVNGFEAKPWGDLPNLGTHKYSGVELPKEVDWVKKGAVTPVKNQGQCGSCWAFSTTGSADGRLFTTTGKLVSLSEQQLVDCSHNGNMGCHGGLMDNGFKYIENNGLCTEDSYPYTAANGKCQADTCTTGVKQGQMSGFKDVERDDMQALMEAVSEGPVSIAIEADHQAFQFYKGGVLTKSCGTMLDHGVLVVGYGSDDDIDFWRVKNSWGPSWGEKGYIRVSRANDDKTFVDKHPADGVACKPVPKTQTVGGECGILFDNSYPTDVTKA
jgi:C1A family cysteine protease